MDNDKLGLFESWAQLGLCALIAIVLNIVVILFLIGIIAAFGR